jgi:SAM-dependent methyltransferase
MHVNKWPKVLPPLTPDQHRVSDDFAKYWLEFFYRQYGPIAQFNHGYVVKRAPKEFVRTLEIGAGIGEHIKYEKLTREQRNNYFAVDIRGEMVRKIKATYPHIKAFVGDCQSRLDCRDNYFDRILAIHVLEHLPNLPAAIEEVHRLCTKPHGVFSVVIPCEGGLAYNLARRISAQRIFERRYKQSYKWFIEREHVNKPQEIIEELERYFNIEHRVYFPLGMPSILCNLCIGLNLTPKC